MTRLLLSPVVDANQRDIKTSSSKPLRTRTTPEVWCVWRRPENLFNRKREEVCVLEFSSIDVQRSESVFGVKKRVFIETRFPHAYTISVLWPSPTHARNHWTVHVGLTWLRIGPIDNVVNLIGRYFDNVN